MIRIGVLASGRGSNFQAIIDAVKSGLIKDVALCLLLTDNPKAFALERAQKHSIECIVLSPKQFSSRDVYFHHIAEEMKKRGIGLIVLAGFMRIIGKPLIDAYPHRIMNIHPALLPSFPGLHGQRDAADYGVKLAGCTVHFVDEGVDTGQIIIQAAVPVMDDDTEDTLAARILRCEHRIYPEAIRLFVEGRLEVKGRKVMSGNMLPPDSLLIWPPLGS